MSQSIEIPFLVGKHLGKDLDKLFHIFLRQQMHELRDISFLHLFSSFSPFDQSDPRLPIGQSEGNIKLGNITWKHGYELRNTNHLESIVINL